MEWKQNNSFLHKNKSFLQKIMESKIEQVIFIKEQVIFTKDYEQVIFTKDNGG